MRPAPTTLLILTAVTALTALWNTHRTARRTHRLEQFLYRDLEDDLHTLDDTDPPEWVTNDGDGQP